jgi:hypothetical protein
MMKHAAYAALKGMALTLAIIDFWMNTIFQIALGGQ